MGISITEPATATSGQAKSQSLGPVALAALGIVYGDLGTSPLYTFQTIVGTVGGHPSAADALGLLSLVLWALIITVSIKYCVFVMRADNRGEGGILALMSLVTRRTATMAQRAGADGAVRRGAAVRRRHDHARHLRAERAGGRERRHLRAQALRAAGRDGRPAGLFAAQVRGTASIGRVFGPVMLLWFATIGVLGLLGLLHAPRCCWAINPVHALRFLAGHGLHSFIVLGAVFLAVTGGEALYADMGSLGRRPIRVSWYAWCCRRCC